MSKGIAQPNDKKKNEKGRYRKGKADDYDKSEKVTCFRCDSTRHIALKCPH